MVYGTIKLVVIVVTVIVLFSPLVSESQAPRLINFQGHLTNQQGDSLNGTYNLKFSIYPSPDQNASPLWTEEHLNVSASKGIVNILLGSIQSFDEPVKVTFDQERYLGITIDCDHDPNTKEQEMTPRQRILPAIYAYAAGTAYNADIAGNADKLDGKDSSEYTTPEIDAGRPGVVQSIYEGNIRLIDKYLGKEAMAVDADKLDGYDSCAFLIKANGGTIEGGVSINGNVGIGTANPARKLHILGDTDIFRAEGGSGFIDIDGSGKRLTGSNGIEFRGQTNVGPQMVLKPTGHVGIGTTNPSASLHVLGDIKGTGIPVYRCPAGGGTYHGCPPTCVGQLDTSSFCYEDYGSGCFEGNKKSCTFVGYLLMSP